MLQLHNNKYSSFSTRMFLLASKVVLFLKRDMVKMQKEYRVKTYKSYSSRTLGQG